MTFLRFLWQHLYDGVVLGLVLALAFITLQLRMHERIVLADGRGTRVYDKPALQKLLQDLEVRDAIDLELDHTWVELAAQHNPKVNAVMEAHVAKIKQLQAKLK